MKHELSPFFNLNNLKCIWVKSDLVKISVRQRQFIPQGHMPFQMEPYVASFTTVCSHFRPRSVPGSAPHPAQLLFTSLALYHHPSFLLSFPLSFRERKQNQIPLLGPVAQFSGHCWLLLPLAVSSLIFPSARLKKKKNKDNSLLEILFQLSRAKIQVRCVRLVSQAQKFEGTPKNSIIEICNILTWYF